MCDERPLSLPKTSLPSSVMMSHGSNGVCPGSLICEVSRTATRPLVAIATLVR
jgi:hypothetical protein